MNNQGIWLLGGAALFLIGRAIYKESEDERRLLTIARYEIRSPKIKKERTLAFLSDLHDCRFGGRHQLLLGHLRRIEPDAVLIGGDMLTAKRTVRTDVAESLCKRLTERWQVFYAEGNHEARFFGNQSRYGDAAQAWKEALEEVGVTFLRDESALLGDDIRITGLCISENFYRKFCPDRMEKSYIEAHVGQPDPERFQILLSHSPAFHEAYAAWGADLTLAGHFHGGTIGLPGGIGLMTPQMQFFQKNVRGMHLLGKSRMIVSPGLGTHSINIRINNLPQIVSVRFVPEDTEKRG